jgi:C4-dicarboxylate transporter DctM subunit
MSSLLLFVMLFAFMFLGMPVSMALGLSSLLHILIFSNDSMASLSIKLYETSEFFTLMAIPFFILGGALMSNGGVARRLVALAIASVGHIRGGMAIAAVLACALFAAVSGSSPATVVAIGTIMIAGMIKAGYPRDFAAGVLCNAGTLGILIPPSIVMVVYAAVTDTSVGRLFMAGIVPGILLAGLFMLSIYLRAGKMNLPALPKASRGEFWKAFRDAIWGLMLLVIIMGGIYGGIFTPTEAAAVSAVYALFVSLFIYKDLTFKDLPRVFREASKTTVMLMFIIANAILFAHVLTSERIPQNLADQIVAIGMSPWMFLLVVNIILLIAGNFMEPSAIILILGPIFYPIALKLGIDPIHLGIIMVVNMEIGLITPPVGLNLFVTSGITGMTVVEVVKAALPWLFLLLGFLVVITYVPFISLGLPDLLMGVATH